MSLKLPRPAAKVKFQQNDMYLTEICWSGILQLVMSFLKSLLNFFLERETEPVPDNYFLAHGKGETHPFSILHCNTDCLDLIPSNGPNT